MTTTGRVVLGTTSAIVMAIAAGLLTATVVLGVLVASEDADGFVNSPDVELSSDGYAVTTEDVDFGSVPEEWLPDRFLGTFRIEAESDEGAPVFIGIGPANEVESYLTNVERSEVRNFGRRRSATYEVHPGNSLPELPSSQEFWTASTEGSGQQTLDWEPRSGSWTLVIMNADGSEGVDLTASTGIDSPWIVVALVIVGAIGMGATLLAIVLAAIALRHPATKPVTATDPPQLTGVAS